jgi:glycosyltransferase involved in cell wall biosynthesis
MPPFAIKQVVEDAQRAAFYSGVERPLVVAMKTIYNLPRTFFGEVTGRKSPMVKRMEELGIVGDYDFNIYQPVNDIEKEIIVVNDCSTDTSLREIERYIQNFPNQGIFLVSHQINQGKGATLRTGIGYATGDYTIIQDADLELDPNDYNIILMPVLEKTADIVYGSRFLKEKKEGAFFSVLANSFLTQLSNFVFRLKITDMETCYKLIPTPIFQALILVENRFGFEPEITAKLAKIKHLKWAEVPITYNPRTNVQGKKIGWQDGIRAMFCIIRYGWFWKAEKSFKNSSAFTDSDKH